MLYFSYNFYKIIFVGLFRAVYNIGKMLFSPYRNYKSNQAMNNEELDKLEKLIILKMQGAITEDEFEEQKEKIMKKHKKTSR